ncbi:hypothetical protein GCM10028815_32950 [Mariniluteicoccus flavus]
MFARIRKLRDLCVFSLPKRRKPTIIVGALVVERAPVYHVSQMSLPKQCFFLNRIGELLKTCVLGQRAPRRSAVGHCEISRGNQVGNADSDVVGRSTGESHLRSIDCDDPP